jgi:hypothetical protein
MEGITQDDTLGESCICCKRLHNGRHIVTKCGWVVKVNPQASGSIPQKDVIVSKITTRDDFYTDCGPNVINWVSGVSPIICWEAILPIFFEDLLRFRSTPKVRGKLIKLLFICQ